MNEDIFNSLTVELQGTIDTDLGDEVITKSEWDEDPFGAVVRHLMAEAQ